ncbi:MAG TPA: RdgB/HAM1 family non-canonical purine NTP pyrophosphatase [Myxococcota bacterium]|nr:RdgB/HAM1 family non-canonical purine NTP pyrophosphatase [Myxococcota bacterium]
MSAARGPELVVATGNEGKLREFRSLLGEMSLVLRSLREFPDVALPEEGDDYERNALAKARSAARQTGLPALADDSGLEVDGLGGAPGPRSARYGGPGLDDAGRVEHLLRALRGCSGDARHARFVCVAALALPDGEAWTARGECAGVVLEAPRGGGGFGYDPVFWSSEARAGVAELPEDRKNEISHRGRALRALRARIEERVVAGPRVRPDRG